MVRRRVAAPSNLAEFDATRDQFFNSMRQAAQRDLDREISVSTDSERNTVGLPLPSLCWKYLLQSTTFPMPRITHITGQEGCAKTALLYDMMIWHLTYGGGGAYIENENKDQPDFRNSFFEWKTEWMNRIDVNYTATMEEWQDTITRYLAIARAQQDAPGGPGRTIPVVLGLDSIMGTSPAEELHKILTSGHATRGFALAANLIALYMRAVPYQIRGYPFSIIGTNHLKPSMTPQGLPTSNIPGGKSVKFMENYELEMSTDMNKDIDKADYGGLRVKIVARKNSLGISRRNIRAQLLWWFKDIDGVRRQVSAWDWDTATVELLLAFHDAKGKKTLFNAIREVVDINVISKGERTAWSRVLGVPRTQPVYFREIGMLLESRPDLLSQLYPLLNISERCPFLPGVDYRTLQSQAVEGAVGEARDLYVRNRRSLPNVEADPTTFTADDPDPDPDRESDGNPVSVFVPVPPPPAAPAPSAAATPVRRSTRQAATWGT